MTMIPDCRTDENYNEKYLNDANKEFIKGYDYAVEQILNLVDNNSDVYPDFDDLLDPNKGIVNVDKKKIVHEAVDAWAECQRDETITSMIDNMDDDEYEKNKKAAEGKQS